MWIYFTPLDANEPLLVHALSANVCHKRGRSVQAAFTARTDQTSLLSTSIFRFPFPLLFLSLFAPLSSLFLLPSYHCTALFFLPLIPFISTLTSLTFSRFLLFPSVFFTSRAPSFPLPRSPHFFPFTFPVPIVNHQTCPIPLFSPLSILYPSRFSPFSLQTFQHLDQTGCRLVVNYFRQLIICRFKH